MNKNYEKEKEEIFKRAKERANEIITKYKDVDASGQLDGVQYSNELKKDSKIVLKELEDLDRKYHIQ